MKNEAVVHIGLHKTGSTTLQEKIFKNIVKKYDLVSNLNNEKLGHEILNNLARVENNKSELNKIKKLTLNKGFISSESLSGPRGNPAFYKFYRDFNYNLFGKDAHILIFIRKPSEYLSSIYLQNIHKGKIINPEENYLNKDN